MWKDASPASPSYPAYCNINCWVICQEAVCVEKAIFQECLVASMGLHCLCFSITPLHWFIGLVLIHIHFFVLKSQRVCDLRGCLTKYSTVFCAPFGGIERFRLGSAFETGNDFRAPRITSFRTFRGFSGNFSNTPIAGPRFSTKGTRSAANRFYNSQLS